MNGSRVSFSWLMEHANGDSAVADFLSYDQEDSFFYEFASLIHKQKLWIWNANL